MGGSDENLIAVTRPSQARGSSTNRRALSAINENIIGGGQRRVLKETNVGCHKIPELPVHRPITRKFAAQLARKEQPSQEEHKPPLAPILSSHQDDEDCVIIDANDYNKPTEDDDVPIFVQNTEAMMDEIDQMDSEIEMEDIDGDNLVLDIDSCDKNNPLAATEYIEELYTFYREIELLGCVPHNYMEGQVDINERMRGILIDWLIEVHYKFELMEETLYLTVNLIDRFLAVRSIARKKLQLVGVTALLLACKYEEVSVPVVEDLVLITDKAYSRKEVLDMEKLMVNTLNFNVSLPTPYVFMRRFLKAAQSDKNVELVVFYMAELCLVEYEMLRFPPSLLAAAAVFTAQCALSGRKQWSRTSEKHTNYTEDQLMECAKLMASFHQKSGTGKLTGVHKKYSTSCYGYAARVDPPLFIMD